MNARIVEGSTVLAPNAEQGGEIQEAQACGPVQDGDVQVRFTTRGVECAVSVSKVQWVADPW